MLLNKKKLSNVFIFLLILVITLFIFLFSITPGIKSDLEQSIKIKLNQAVLLRSIKISDNSYKDIFKKTFYSLENFIINQHKFEEIELNIPFTELEKIKKNREEALRLKRLINPTNTKIELVYNGKKYNATARLKGDLSDHWGNVKQWSLRIKLKKNQTIFGLNSFGIMMHETRYFPYNYIIEDVMKNYGLLGTYYQPIKVKVNGDNWGVMLLEEQYSDSFFARNKIKEAPLFRFKSETGEHLMTVNSDILNIKDISRWQGVLDVVPGYKKVFKKSSIPDKETNQTLLSLAKNIHQTLVFEQNKFFNEMIKFIDVKKFAKAYAIVSAFGSSHSSSANNIRYYINPYNLKIEPILRDHAPNFDWKPDNKSIDDIFFLLRNNKDFKETYKKTIHDLNNNLDWILKRSKEICQPFGKICSEQFDFKELKQSLNILKNKEFIITAKLNEDNFKKFDTKNTDNINKEKLYIRIFTDGTLYASNLTSEKIFLKNISFIGDKNCQNCNLEINENIEPSSFKNISIYENKLNFKGLKSQGVEIYYLDEKKNIFSQSSIMEDHKLIPTLMFDKNRKKNNKLIRVEGKNYVLTKGQYFFEEPIIIPSGFNFIVEAGSILKMSENSYIKIENGSIALNGTSKMPIIIESNKKDRYWKGIYVNSNSLDKNESTIKNVKITNIDYFNDGFIQLTGAINFYNTRVSIFKSKFSNSTSEDLINLINSDFKINDIEIYNARSDGIDFDFSKGTFDGGIISNIGGDGLDFSGSTVKLKNVNFELIGDKAISVGEKSFIIVSNLNISSSKIGIASKDSSSLKGKNIYVEKCGWYDFAAYNKKSYFKGGYINLEKVSTCNKSIVQEDSTIIINNKKLNTKNINVNKLYKGIYQ